MRENYHFYFYFLDFTFVLNIQMYYYIHITSYFTSIQNEWTSKWERKEKIRENKNCRRVVQILILNIMLICSLLLAFCTNIYLSIYFSFHFHSVSELFYKLLRVPSFHGYHINLLYQKRKKTMPWCTFNHCLLSSYCMFIHN